MQWSLPPRPIGRVQTRHQTLCGRLFIACCAIDLPRKEQTLRPLDLKAQGQRSGIKEIILDRISGLQDPNLLQSLNGPDIGFLHINRQGRRNPVRIDRIVIQPFRFQKDLMRFLFGKTHHLVFNRRAIARADAFDMATIHSGTRQVRPHNLVRPGIGMGDPATDLPDQRLCVQERKNCRFRIPRLTVQPCPINRFTVQPRRCSCFQPPPRQFQFCQPFRQQNRGAVAHPAARLALIPDMNDSV